MLVEIDIAFALLAVKPPVVGRISPEVRWDLEGVHVSEVLGQHLIPRAPIFPP